MLDLLKNRTLSIPVWNEALDSRGSLRYQVAAFAKIRILSYHLSGQDKLSVRFLGYDATCGDAPTTVAADDAYSVNEGDSLTISAPGVLANDSSTTNNPLSAALSDNVTHGTLALRSDGSFDYTPNANFSGSDSFTYRANDGAVDSNLATVSLTIHPLNDAPLAVDDSATVDEDSSIVIAVLDNDSDIDGDALTIDEVTTPASGSTVVQAEGTILYTPDADFCGDEPFTYRVSDGHNGSDEAPITVKVACINDTPVAREDTANTDEDTPVRVSVLANDSDADGNTLSVSAISDPEHGSAAINADQTVLYTPDPDYSGDDSFTYTLCDGSDPCPTVIVRVAIGIRMIHRKRTTMHSTAEETPLTLNVAANDSDVDANLDPATAAMLEGPTHGALDNNNDGTFDYTPELNFNGADGFTYEICDTDGLCDMAAVSIDVIPVNDAPVATEDGCERGSGSTHHHCGTRSVGQ